VVTRGAQGGQDGCGWGLECVSREWSEERGQWGGSLTGKKKWSCKHWGGFDLGTALPGGEAKNGEKGDPSGKRRDRIKERRTGRSIDAGGQRKSATKEGLDLYDILGGVPCA